MRFVFDNEALVRTLYFFKRKFNIREHASQLMKMLLELFAGLHDESTCTEGFLGTKSR